MENNEDKDLEPQGGTIEQESSNSPQQDHMTSSEKDEEMNSEENSATRGNSESNPSSPQEEITDQPNIPKPDDPHSPIVSFKFKLGGQTDHSNGPSIWTVQFDHSI